MLAKGVGNIGYLAKLSSQNTKLMVQAKNKNNYKAQQNVDRSSKSSIQRAQVAFNLIEKRMYRESGKIMSFGYNVGGSFDQRG